MYEWDLSSSTDDCSRISFISQFFKIYSHSSYGPTFGSGHDLGICASSSTCYINNTGAYSYRVPGDGRGLTSLGSNGVQVNFNPLHVEVYDAAKVPVETEVLESK